MTADLTYSEHYRAVTVTFDAMAAVNPRMRQALDAARRLAASDVAVLLLGETGCGKNLVAQAIHNGSPRIEAPFLSVNCSALTETILESELFGHERGAFTGAERQKRGRFELADRGTLFLDEIGDMSPAAQAKILHAIEYKEFQRVGGEQTLRADVRVIAASNKDLSRAMETGAFRRDLFYRLAEATLRIPPLRERKEDIPSLVARMISECNRKFHKAVTGATPQVLALLAAHHWPGNVRELRAVIRRACAVAPSVVITPAEIDLFAGDVAESDAPPAAAPRPPAAAMAMGNGAEPALSLAAMERDHIARVLALTSWNKKEAARTLEISRPTLDRKIRQYGLARE